MTASHKVTLNELRVLADSVGCTVLEFRALGDWYCSAESTVFDLRGKSRSSRMSARRQLRDLLIRLAVPTSKETR